MCCIFWPVFGCCARQMQVKTVIFSIFMTKSWKKQKISSKILQKTAFMKFAPKRWSSVFIPPKKRKKYVFFGIKHSTSVLVQIKKNCFAKFCSKFVTFLCFLSFFAWKMLKMTISTSVWHAEHPNAGQNILQLC